MVARWYFVWVCISMRPAGLYKSHDLLAYISWSGDFGLVIKVKIFVQGRISRPINGSKLIFHMRMYLYETSMNIQAPWPPDLYFTTCRLQTLADFPWLIFLSEIESWALLMVASWYFTSGFTSVRPAASAFMPSIDAWGGARGQYLGHHRFCLTSQRLVDGWLLYLGYWFSMTQILTWNYVCRSVTYISWSSDFVLYLQDYLVILNIYLFLPIVVCWSLIWKCLWI